MSNVLRRLEPLFRWADNYGWSIPVFVVGFAFGAVVMNRSESLVPLISGFGALGAALAALFSNYITLKRDRDAKKPNLNIVDAPATYAKEPPGTIEPLTFELNAKILNMSPFSVYIKGIEVRTHDYRPASTFRPFDVCLDMSAHLYIPAGEVGELKVPPFPFPPQVCKEGEGKLLLYFQHSGTGLVYHSVLANFHIRLPRMWKDNGWVEMKRKLKFDLIDQPNEAGVVMPMANIEFDDPETAAFRRNLLDTGNRDSETPS